MSDVEFLRGKLERLNAEKRCWQLVKEILTFLAKVKREKSEKSEKFEKSEKLEKLAFEKCEKFGFKKLRKLKVGERLAPRNSSRNSPTRSRRFESGMHLGARNRGKLCWAAGEKRAQPFPFFSARESQPAKTRKRSKA